MPYTKPSELPKSVTNVLPAHAQEIYFKAFNNAYDEYKNPEERRGDEDREEVAHKVAWNAVKTKYQKGADGKWHPRET